MRLPAGRGPAGTEFRTGCPGFRSRLSGMDLVCRFPKIGKGAGPRIAPQRGRLDGFHRIRRRTAGKICGWSVGDISLPCPATRILNEPGALAFTLNLTAPAPFPPRSRGRAGGRTTPGCLGCRPDRPRRCGGAVPKSWEADRAAMRRGGSPRSRFPPRPGKGFVRRLGERREHLVA